MGTCCTTRDKSINGELASKNGDQQSQNEVQKSLTYITNYLNANRDTQSLVLIYSKDQLRNFIIGLSSIMTIIKTKTGQMFVPVALQNSPHNPERDMMIIMKSVDRIDKYALDREETLDENKLAKQFQTRSFQFLTSDPGERKNQLKNDLKNSYMNEGLMIIGGIQDPGKVNQLHLLLYKTEQNRQGNTGENCSYEISVDVKPQVTDDKDFEILINQAQVENNYQLRSIISFEDTYSRHHFVVFQVVQADRLYIINKFPNTISEEVQKMRDLNRQLNGPAGSGSQSKTDAKAKQPQPQTQAVDSFTLKMGLQEKLTTYLNAEERKNEQSIVECIVNTKFEDSYLVFSSS